MIVSIVDELAPNLVARNSIGHESAAQLLLTAGDNMQRLRSEAALRRTVRRQPSARFIRQDNTPSTEQGQTVPPTAHCISSPLVGCGPIPAHRLMSQSV